MKRNLLATLLVAIFLISGFAQAARFVGTPEITTGPAVTMADVPTPDGIVSIPGPQGDKGPQGEPGLQGNTGSQGSRGYTGYTGSTGAQGSHGRRGATGYRGPQGYQGPRGDKGDKGDTGPQGQPALSPIIINTTTPSGVNSPAPAGSNRGKSMDPAWKLLWILLILAAGIGIFWGVVSWLVRLGREFDLNASHSRVGPLRTAMGNQPPPAYAGQARGSGFTRQYDSHNRIIGEEKWSTIDPTQEQVNTTHQQQANQRPTEGVTFHSNEAWKSFMEANQTEVNLHQTEQ